MVQLFTMVAIPISGLLIIRPQLTIFYLLFFATSLWYSPKRFGKKFIHFVLIVATLGLIITLLALYELMLIMQVHIETGIKGSSARSAPILSTVCTWMVLEK